MKINLSVLPFIMGCFILFPCAAQQSDVEPKVKKMYIDVHVLEPGKVKFN